MNNTRSLPTYDALIADLNRLIDKLDYHSLRIVWQMMRALAGEPRGWQTLKRLENACVSFYLRISTVTRFDPFSTTKESGLLDRSTSTGTLNVYMPVVEPNGISSFIVDKKSL